MSEITELQIKVSFLEESLEELNQVVTRQANELLTMKTSHDMLLLRLKRLEQSVSESGAGQEDLAHERPPHY